MKVASYLYQNGKITKQKAESLFEENKCQLVLGFGGKQIFSKSDVYKEIHQKFNNAQIAMCSTAGEIYENEVLDNALSITAISFENTEIKTAQINIKDFQTSFEAGVALINMINNPQLKHAFVLSDGGEVNGSELVRGIESITQNKILVTGGLAGDGSDFKNTLVGLNESPSQGKIVAIGLYGDHIQVSHGSMGGWDTFGIEKMITKSTGNELFEIDNLNALDLYKKYLGKYSSELPGSALLFPISIKLENSNESVVRTILSINNETNSMIFAGDVPEGSKIRFMKANFDKLIDAASDAAQYSLSSLGNDEAKLAILISCVGRKIILGNRIEEEVEAVKGVLNKNTLITGFYSYGEISPFSASTKCELHNQTMTITTFNEI